MPKQCDQKTRLCFQYLAIFIIKNLPKSIKIVSKWVENFTQNQIILIVIANFFKYRPKWWNFAKSGHTVPNQSKYEKSTSAENAILLHWHSVMIIITLNQEPWSSGYGRKLMFWRSWVQIPEPYIGWTFFHVKTF